MRQLNHCRAAQNFEQHSHTFAGDALHKALDTAQGIVLQAHRLSLLELADFLQGGVVAVLFELPNALNKIFRQDGRLKPKAHDVGHAFGAAHSRDALLGLAGPEQNVAWKHGLKQRDWTLLCFFEFFIPRQIRFKRLLLQINLCDVLLPGLGVGQIPAIDGRGIARNQV